MSRKPRILKWQAARYLIVPLCIHGFGFHHDRPIFTIFTIFVPNVPNVDGVPQVPM